MIERGGKRLLAGALAALCVLPAFGRQAAGEAPAQRQAALESIDPKYRPILERAYRRAASSPDDAQAFALLGMTLQSLGSHESAEEAYRQALKLDPQAFRVAYYLGIVLERLNRPAEAIKTIEDALRTNGACPPCRVRLGDLLRAGGELEAGEKQYRLALEQSSDLASARYGLGRVHAARAEWAAAAEQYELACASAKNYGAAYYALGLTYRKLGEQEKAARALSRFERLRPVEPPSFDPLIDALDMMRGKRRSGGGGDGRTLTKQQQQTLADELERTLRADPDSLSAHVNLITLYREMGALAKAEEHYRAAIAIDPSHADAHYNWGRASMARGEAAEAGRLFERALAADPDHVEALVQSGLLLERTGSAEEGEKRYRRALEIDPLQRQAHYLLARRLVRLERYGEAVSHLEETIRIEDSLTPQYMRALAATHERAGELEKAVSYLRAARERAVSETMGDLTKSLDADLARLGAAAEAP